MGTPTGRQNVVRSGHVVPERDRRVRPHEDRSGRPDPLGDRSGVDRLDLQVLGGIGVNHGDALLQVIYQHDG